MKQVFSKNTIWKSNILVRVFPIVLNRLSDLGKSNYFRIKRILIIFLFSISTLICSAQNILQLSDKKSVHVVCPDKVLYVSCGDDSEIQAEILPELSNIVRVKALHPFEGQTSLTVVCAGRIYSVAAQFGSCDVLTYQLESLPSEKAFPFSGKLMPDESLKGVSDQVLSRKRNHTVHRSARKNGILMEVRGISIKGDALFLAIQVTNHTNMAFDVGAFNFWIADKRQQKATNVQEYQLTPDYARFELKRVPARGRASEVFVIEKLTIPDKRILRIEIIEKSTGNTGRKLTLELKNRDLRKAAML